MSPSASTPEPDIDPALAARLDGARPGERVEALLLVRRGVRASGGPGLPKMVEMALGSVALETVEVRVFESLGALFVAGPAELVRRLLADPDVISATLPDRSE